MTNISRSLQIRAVAAIALLCGAFWFPGVSGCGSGDRIDPAVEKLGRATGPVAPVQRQAPAAAMAGRALEPTGKLHRGTILETINVPNYTYLRFRNEANEEIWAAVPADDRLGKGQAVAIVESIVMTDFPSRSLGRTFASIIFGMVKTGGEATGDRPDAEADSGAGGGAPDRPALPPGHPPVNAR